MIRSFHKGLVLCGCLAGTLWAAQAALWIDVPFVKQERNGCGAASIAMVMQYWQRQQPQAGSSADAPEIQRALYSGKVHGIYASDVQRYFDEHGFRTFAFRGEWSDLKLQLEKGRPLIVALKPQREADLHYLVVAGIDEERKLVLVNDPAERKLLEREWQTFEREWKDAGYWTLLAVPQEPAPSVR